MKRLVAIFLSLLLALTASGCGGPSDRALTSVKLMLDWVPNTNHTGIFVARSQGYFREAGLEVEIIQPGEVYPEAAVTGGIADFGVSFQDSLTLARANQAPIVSIAAILQHNTSGFASLVSRNIKGPKDFEGLTYGAFGSPFEEPTLKVLMESQGGDYAKLKIQNIGFSDPLPLLQEGKIDLAWIFYAWAGIQAQQQGVDLNVVMMKDYFNAIPDYYTPVIIASESTLAEKPEVVKAFLKALSRGYEYTINNPAAAGDVLLAAAPELDAKLVKASQLWLTDYYKAGAPRWGEQQKSVWEGYIGWMAAHKILEKPLSAADAYTNAYLP